MNPTPTKGAEDRPIEACSHMEDYVSALADNSLTGPMRWYTRLHVLYCSRCGPALKGLLALRARLKALIGTQADTKATVLTDERKSAIDHAMDTLDKRE